MATERAAKRAAAVDWTNIPRELLEIIFRRLRSAKEVIGFGAVCKSWRSVASDRRLATPLCPMLWLNSLPGREKVRWLLDLSDKKIHRIKLDVPYNHLVSPYATRGWLVISVDYQKKENYLLNPLSQELKIKLPPLVPFPDDDDDDDGETPLGGQYMFVLSSSPLDPNCIMVAWNLFRIIFCKINDDDDTCWKSIYSSYSDRIDSIAYCNNNLYAAKSNGDVLFVELCPPDDQPPRVKLIIWPATVIDTEFSWAFNLFSTMEFDVDLLQFLHKVDDNSVSREALKLKRNCNTWEWDKATSLGDNAILASDCAEFTTISTLDSSELIRPNCVYYNPYVHSTKRKIRTHEFDLRTGKVVTRTILQLPQDQFVGKFVASWFTPDISSARPQRIATASAGL